MNLGHTQDRLYPTKEKVGNDFCQIANVDLSVATPMELDQNHYSFISGLPPGNRSFTL